MACKNHMKTIVSYLSSVFSRKIFLLHLIEVPLFFLLFFTFVFHFPLSEEVCCICPYLVFVFMLSKSFISRQNNLFSFNNILKQPTQFSIFFLRLFFNINIQNLNRCFISRRRFLFGNISTAFTQSVCFTFCL